MRPSRAAKQFLEFQKAIDESERAFWSKENLARMQAQLRPPLLRLRASVRECEEALKALTMKAATRARLSVPRRCWECHRQFLPRVLGQKFCPGGKCRKKFASHSEAFKKKRAAYARNWRKDERDRELLALQHAREKTSTARKVGYAGGRST